MIEFGGASDDEYKLLVKREFSAARAPAQAAASRRHSQATSGLVCAASLRLATGTGQETLRL